jgi:hypothetical protein
MLRAKSRETLLACDLATPKEFAQVASQILELIVQNVAEVHYLAFDKNHPEDDSKAKAKPLSMHFKQVIWLGANGIWDYFDYSIFKKDRLDLQACITNTMKLKPVRSKWHKAPENTELVKVLRDFKSECIGCETLCDSMVAEGFGSNNPLTVANVATVSSRLQRNKRKGQHLALYCAFHPANTRTNCNNLIGKIQHARGSPVVPSSFLFVARVSGHVIYNEASAKVAQSFVNNNGQRLIENLPNKVISRPPDLAEQCDKVRQLQPWSLRSNFVLDLDILTAMLVFPILPP